MILIKMQEFKVNEYITLKLEDGEINIYVNGELFNQCKYILMRKTVYEFEDFFEEIESVDELFEHLDHSLEAIEPELIDIPPETRFWVHCSNMQAWAENNYDTRLLHSNLAFPLLKELSQPEIGDLIAKKVYKEEIIKRIQDGFVPTVLYLIMNKYLDFFTSEEVDILYDELAPQLSKEIKLLQVIESLAKKNFELINNIRRDVKLGVMCNINEINGIKINNRIVNFPEILTEFKCLRYLDLNNNNIEFVPESIGKMKSLEYLDLGGNKLKYLPKTIKKLSYLKYLNISENNFREFPKVIKYLSKLQTLTISYNYLKEIPHWLGNLSNLKELIIAHNNIKILPNSLNNLKNLSILILKNNLIESIPKNLVELRNLSYLDLSNNQLKKSDLKIIESIKKKLPKRFPTFLSYNN